MTPLVGIAVVVVVVAIVAVIVVATRAGRRRDGVDSFRRQIDALSPEARRPVVDQVQSVAEREHDDDPEGEHGQDDARGA